MDSVTFNPRVQAPTYPRPLMPAMSFNPAAPADTYRGAVGRDASLDRRTWQQAAAPAGAGVPLTRPAAAAQPPVVENAPAETRQMPGQAPLKKLVDGADAQRAQADRLKAEARAAGELNEALQVQLDMATATPEQRAALKSLQALCRRDPAALSAADKQKLASLTQQLDSKLVDLARKQVRVQQEQASLLARADERSNRSQALETNGRATYGPAAQASVKEYRGKQDGQSKTPAVARRDQARRDLAAPLAGLLDQADEKKARAAELEAQARRFDDAASRTKVTDRKDFQLESKEIREKVVAYQKAYDLFITGRGPDPRKSAGDIGQFAGIVEREAQAKADAAARRAESQKASEQAASLENEARNKYPQSQAQVGAYRVAQEGVRKEDQDAGKQPRPVQLDDAWKKKVDVAVNETLPRDNPTKAHARAEMQHALRDPKLGADLADALARKAQDGSMEAQAMLREAAKNGNERARKLVENLPVSPTEQIRIREIAAGLGQAGKADELTRLAGESKESARAIYKELGSRIGSLPADSPEAKRAAAWLQQRAEKDPHARAALDKAGFQRALRSDAGLTPEQVKADLQTGLKSKDPAVRAEAAEELARRIREDKSAYGHMQALADANTPESWDSVAGLASDPKSGYQARAALDKGGAPALQAVVGRWDEATPEAKKGLTQALQNPATLKQALESGVPAELARVLGQSLRSEWPHGTADDRLRVLSEVKTEAARAGLADAANHPEHGKHAAAALAKTREGRATALAALDKAEATAKRNLIAPAFQGEQFNESPEARAKFQQLASGDDAELRQAALEAAKKLPYDQKLEPATRKAIIDGALKEFKAGRTEQGKGLVQRLLFSNQLTDVEAHKLNADLREAARRHDKPEVAGQISGLANEIADRQLGAGNRKFSEALEKNDIKGVAENLSKLDAKGYAMLTAQLESVGLSVPQWLEKVRTESPAEYARMLDGLMSGGKSEGIDMLTAELNRRAKQPGDRTVHDFTARNSGKDRDSVTMKTLTRLENPSLALDQLESMTAKARAEGRPLGEHHTALGKVLDQTTDPAMKKRAAEALMASPAGSLSGESVAALVDYAAESGDQALKDRVLAYVPAPPVDEARLAKIPDFYRTRLEEAIKFADPGSEMHSLGECYKALGLASHPKYGKNVNKAEIERQIKLLMEGPLAPQLARLMEGAKRDAIGPRGAELQVDYVKGDAIQQRLRLLPPDKAKELQQKELGKLAGIAKPEDAQAATAEFARKNISEKGPELFNGLPEADRPAAARQALITTLKTAIEQATNPEEKSSLEEALKLVTTDSDFAKKFTDELTDVAKGAGSARKFGSALMRAVSKLAGGADAASDQKKWKSLEKALGSIEDRGRLGSLSAVAGVAGLIAKGGPQDLGDWGTVSSVVGSTEDATKLLSWLSGVKPGAKGISGAAIGRLAQLGGALKFCGPLGDFASGVNDILDARKEYESGDHVGMTGKLMSGAGALGLGICGTLTIVGVSTGPVGWVCLGVMGAGMIIHGFFSEDEEESFLRRGVKIRGTEMNFWQG